MSAKIAERLKRGHKRSYKYKNGIKRVKAALYERKISFITKVEKKFMAYSNSFRGFSPVPCGVVRRLACGVYDGVRLFATCHAVRVQSFVISTNAQSQFGYFIAHLVIVGMLTRKNKTAPEFSFAKFA